MKLPAFRLFTVAALLAACGAVAQVTFTDGSNEVTVPGASPAGARVTLPAGSIAPKPADPPASEPPVEPPGPIASDPTPPTNPTLPAGIVAVASVPQGYQLCAKEWARCSYQGTREVAFGAGTKWWLKKVTGQFECSHRTFGGDPIVGTEKACWSFQPDVVITPSPTDPVPVDPGQPQQPGQAAAPSVEEPFAADSFWKAKIPDNAQYGSLSDPRAVSLRAAGTIYVNTNRFTQWVNIGKSTDPLVTVSVSAAYIGDQRGARPGTVQIRMPAGARRDPGVNGGADDASWRCVRNSDGHATFIDPDGVWAHEFWQFCNTNPNGSGQWQATAYSRTRIAGYGTGYNSLSQYNSAVTSFGWGATRAYGGSALAGLIRAGEIVGGKGINHKIFMSLPKGVLFYNAGNPASGAVCPAMRPDTAGGTGPLQTIRHGEIFAIPKSVDITKQGFSAAGLVFAKAAQDYGIFIGDQSGGAVINTEGHLAQRDGQALMSAGADRAKITNMLVPVYNLPCELRP